MARNVQLTVAGGTGIALGAVFVLWPLETAAAAFMLLILVTIGLALQP